MKASEILQERINQSTNTFSVSRNGELVEIPLNINLRNKAGSLTFDLIANNKLCFTGNKADVLKEVDVIVEYTTEELNTYLSDKPNAY